VDSKTDKKAEAKPEEKAEKLQYDIKLSSFDAGKKIALIKEIRGWLNLGLKEVPLKNY
jgi:large subunit ribosomal protein L7/L12